MVDDLVPVNLYSKDIKQLNILKRVSLEYPLLCRKEVAKKLAEVSKKLPKGLKLQVDSAYRTRKTQEILYKNRRKEVHWLVFNPNSGVPPHCTGGAVDVSLVDEFGKELNLSEPFKKFYDEPKLNSIKITKIARKHRFLLHELMLNVGFAPNEREYWHFSYGDLTWAKHYKKEILYEECSLPNEYYFSKNSIFVYKLIKKIWSFYNKIFRIQTNY